MRVSIHQVSPAFDSINCAFTVGIHLEYNGNGEIPIYVLGVVKSSDGKIISHMTEIAAQRNSDFQLHLVPPARRTTHAYLHLYAPVEPKAVNHIERLREKDSEKSVNLRFEVTVKMLDSPLYPADFVGGMSGKPLLTYKETFDSAGYVIKQSDWVSKYAPYFGLGNFLLLELQLPDLVKVESHWKELYERLSHRLKEMEIAIRQGEWQKTMMISRQFAELLRLNDKKSSSDKKLKEDLTNLFLKDLHSPEAVDELYSTIHHFFNYTSKFVHDKEPNGLIKPIPVPHKEDAYFVYAMAIGLLNVIGKKINVE